ncbi:hypothetical protein [Microbacterium tumbae]
MSARIRRIGDAALAGLAARASADLPTRRALGMELDASADILLLGGGAGGGPDRTAAAGFLLALTRRVIVVPVIGSGQHPINVGRAIATLTNLHDRRVGIAGEDASVLTLLSRLFESWPLASVVGDVEGGVYVDDARILRIDDPAHAIGGPLTVPVDVADKPVTVLLDAAGEVAPGIDVVLDPTAVPAWDAAEPPVSSEPPVSGAPVGARTAFGLSASVPFATGSPAFTGAGRLDQV